MQIQINRSKSQKIDGKVQELGRKSHSSKELNKEIKLKPNFMQIVDD